MYDPKIARFLQEDTYTGDPNDPLSLNLYTYCHNEPLMYTDPTGHEYANVQIGNITFSSGDCTNGITSITVEELKDNPTVTYDLFCREDTIVGNDKQYKNPSEYLNEIAFVGTDGNLRVSVRQIFEDNGYRSDEDGRNNIFSWWKDDAGKTNILVRRELKNAPVQVTRSGNEINIIAFVKFTGDYDKIYNNGAYNSDLTYQQQAEAGILNYWNKDFVGTNVDFGQGNNISLKTKLYLNPQTPSDICPTYSGSDNQDYLNIEIHGDEAGRTSYGITDCGPFWSTRGKSKIYQYDTYDNPLTPARFSLATAHEFGHVLGLDDAYEEDFSGIRVREKAPLYNGEVPTTDIMRGGDNKSVSANDVEMVWEAWKTNKWQSFMDYGGLLFKKSSAIKSK